MSSSSSTTVKDAAAKAFPHATQNLVEDKRATLSRARIVHDLAGFSASSCIFQQTDDSSKQPLLPNATFLSRLLRLSRKNLGQFAHVTYLTTLEIAPINRPNSDNFYRHFLLCSFPSCSLLLRGTGVWFTGQRGILAARETRGFFRQIIFAERITSPFSHGHVRFYWFVTRQASLLRLNCANKYAHRLPTVRSAYKVCRLFSIFVVFVSFILHFTDR